MEENLNRLQIVRMQMALDLQYYYNVIFNLILKRCLQPLV